MCVCEALTSHTLSVADSFLKLGRTLRRKKIVVYESVAVAQYLDMQYPDIPLQSTDPELRAMALTKLADSNNLINAGVFLPMQLFRETDEVILRAGPQMCTNMSYLLN